MTPHQEEFTQAVKRMVSYTTLIKFNNLLYTLSPHPGAINRPCWAQTAVRPTPQPWRPCSPFYHRNSSIYTFRISVQTHCPLLRHRRIAQEIQRHPDQMSPDLIQLLPDLRNRHIKIAQVSLPRAQR